MATANLLEKVPWTDMSEFKMNLTASRTRQLCDAMTVSKELMANLLLSAGGRASISTGGGGSNGELTNWDGTKKRLVGELDNPIENIRKNKYDDINKGKVQIIHSGWQ